jgi:anhydro-N-acetylmuramic acid kinase
MPSLFLGLISGTSADGIDAALLHMDPGLAVVATASRRYPADVREQLLALTASEAAIRLDDLGRLNVTVGELFADAALELLVSADVPPHAVSAIGSHGQTIRHRPGAAQPFSMQIGDPAVIAERTGICTVADFRSADVAAGGQGAPLAPAFHAAVLRGRSPCAVLNLGGISNLSVLDEQGLKLGFDAGPANCLLDAWNERHHGSACDAGGAWASSGAVNADLLSILLDDPYFSADPPKSTGREYFNLEWLDARLEGRRIDAIDVQATLLALSVRTIADAVRKHAVHARELLVCGGGVHNMAMMDALAVALAPLPVASTTAAGIDPDFVEAALFAWLAHQRLAGIAIDLSRISGARGPRLLGAIHAAPPDR